MQAVLKFQIDDGPVQEAQGPLNRGIPAESGQGALASFQELFLQADILGGVKAGRIPVMSTGRQVDASASGTSSKAAAQPARVSDISVLRTDEVYVIPPNFEGGMCVDFYAKSSCGGGGGGGGSGGGGGGGGTNPTPFSPDNLHTRPFPPPFFFFFH